MCLLPLASLARAGIPLVEVPLPLRRLRAAILAWRVQALVAAVGELVFDCFQHNIAVQQGFRLRSTSGARRILAIVATHAHAIPARGLLLHRDAVF